MSPIRKIIEERDRSREAEAAVLAVAALDALWLAGCPAWLFGSLARGAFLGHSDIDILIDATGVAKARAISVCLRALKGHPSSIVFREDLPAHALPHFLEEATDGPRLRGH